MSQQSGSYFLSGNSQTAQEIQARDWQSTSLGDVETWPHSLKTTLSIVLNTPCPMFCIWGRDRTLFYNDASADFFFASSTRPLPMGMRSAIAPRLPGNPSSLG